jgi:hypothetical protein
MELSGGVCGALAAGALDVSRWLPEAVAALEQRCALGGGAFAAPPRAPWAWPVLGLAAVTAVAVAAAGGAGRRGG